MPDKPDTSQPEDQGHIPYKTTYREYPEARVKATVRWANKPSPKVYESLQLWVANFTLRELLNNESYPSGDEPENLPQ